jgi:ribonucleoside-diphosphate reductase alpha chain
MMIKCIKRDGRLVAFNAEKILVAVTKAMTSINDVNADLAKSIAESVTKELSSKKEVSVEEIQDLVEEGILKSGNIRLARSYMSYRMKRAEARELRGVLGVDDDLKFNVNALSLLDKRYLKKIDGKKETPSQLFKRVAKSVASVESKYGNNPDYWAKTFYNLMSNRYFMPNTPCLANAGNTDLNYLFACYAFEIEDSIESIFQTVKNCAIVQKTGGGVGLNLSKLRPMGDNVKTTEGVASGPVDFMRVFDITTDVIKQGGIRRGGNLGLLLVNHPDIIEFVRCKNDETKLNNFNISVAITDDFMRAVKNDTDFPLINPKTGKETMRLSARDLFKDISESAWRNGEPGIVFWDSIEKDNPTPKLGHLIKNLCAEQDLVPFEACCLGSLNLEKFVDDGVIVFDSLRKVINHAVRFLDNVLDESNFPLEDIKKTCQGNRKIGLGVMGWANTLIRLGIPYDSDQAVELAEKVMDFINVEARKASVKLAEEKGSFPNLSISSITGPQRNASITTIAPTGSISTIAETSSGIEPIFAVVYEKTNILEGNTFFEVNPLLEEIGKKEGWYNPTLVNKIIRNSGKATGISEIPEKWQKVFRTAYEITPEWHIKMQAAFQRHTNNSISKTINLPYEATIEDVERAIKLAYDLGLKGLTVFRNNSRSTQVLQTVSEPKKLCIECNTEDGTCSLEKKS